MSTRLSFAFVFLALGCGASQATPATRVTHENESPSTSVEPTEVAAEPTVEVSTTLAPSNPALRVEVMRMERRALELERVASLIVEARESVLHANDPDVHPCEGGGALESLRALGTSGVAGAAFALDAVRSLEDWCTRSTQPEPNPREQRRLLRALESALNRSESHARSEQRNLTEAAAALRPVAGE